MREEVQEFGLSEQEHVKRRQEQERRARGRGGKGDARSWLLVVCAILVHSARTDSPATCSMARADRLQHAWSAAGGRGGGSRHRYRPKALSDWSRILRFDVAQLWCAACSLRAECADPRLDRAISVQSFALRPRASFSNPPLVCYYAQVRSNGNRYV